MEGSRAEVKGTQTRIKREWEADFADQNGQNGKNKHSETVETLINRLRDEDLTVEDLEHIAYAVAAAERMTFSSDDPRRGPAERIRFLVPTLFYHLQEWKWKVAGNIAKHLGETLAEMDEAEEKFYEED